VTTTLGPTVMMIIEDRGKEHLIYLPRRYARAVNYVDIKIINSARVWWTTVYKGFCDYRQLPLL
jgi:hypothetical protein